MKEDTANYRVKMIQGMTEWKWSGSVRVKEIHREWQSESDEENDIVKIIQRTRVKKWYRDWREIEMGMPEL